MGEYIHYERCTYCHKLYPSTPYQIGTFLEYREFMCFTCSKRYEFSNSLNISGDDNVQNTFKDS